MAIYSLSRKTISKALRPCYACAGSAAGASTCGRCGGRGEVRDRDGFAADHARYVLRPAACSTIVARLPPMVPRTRAGVAAWMGHAQRTDRKNARVADRLMSALPLELTRRAERAALVRDFYDRLTVRPERARPSGPNCIATIPYFAGLHDLAGDADNPHQHGVLRDRCLCCGSRVVGLGELGTTEWIRATWEATVNAHLSAAGFYETVDRRSYARLGIAGRSPGRHRGPSRAA
jgi:hypothetical protein